MSTTRRLLRCRRAWQPAFLRLLPKITAYIVPAFRYLRGDERADAVQEAIGHAFLAFVGLKSRGCADRIYPTPLARYAIHRVRQQRSLALPMNSLDVHSRRAQRQRGFRVERLEQSRVDRGSWRETLVEDRRTPVLDQVWFRIDFPEWLSRLSSRDQGIAEYLASGHSTQAAARKFHVSSGRISQLRRELHESWDAFHAGSLAIAVR